MARPAIENAEVAAVFASYPPGPRRRLLALRTLILKTARAEDVGPIEETLKWGEPAYLTSQSKSGSTIRIAWKPAEPERYAIYFHCQTNLVERFRELFPDEFEFDGNRRLVFAAGDPLPREPLSFCIAAALTYHRDKKNARLG